MKKNRNKNDHGISLMITLTSIPAWWWILVIWFLIVAQLSRQKFDIFIMN